MIHILTDQKQYNSKKPTEKITKKRDTLVRIIPFNT